MEATGFQEWLQSVWVALLGTSEKVFLLSILFFGLALLIKRDKAVSYGKGSWHEVRLNLIYQVMDLIAIVPIIVVAMAAITSTIEASGVVLFTRDDFVGTPIWITLIACIAVSDFVGYWRHRFLHLRVMWPVHAIHHSDTQMTFTTLMRFHPINRLVTVSFNSAVLAMVGFPVEAIVLNGLIRHYYGFYVHAALPWTYGVLGYVFVSPVMHRWHHIKEIRGHGKNYATIFALYDVIFGTYYVPSAETPALGISERRFPTTWGGQVLYPFRVWLGLAAPGSDLPLTPEEEATRSPG